MKRRHLSIALFLALGCLAFAEERFFEIRATKFSYTPQRITVQRGDTVTVRLISEEVTHGLFVDGYGVATQAHPGQDGSLSFTADRTGRFSLRCSVTCGEFHPFMVGYLVVQPNARLAAFAAIALAGGLGSLGTALLKKKG